MRRREFLISTAALAASNPWHRGRQTVPSPAARIRPHPRSAAPHASPQDAMQAPRDRGVRIGAFCVGIAPARSPIIWPRLTSIPSRPGFEGRAPGRDAQRGR